MPGDEKQTVPRGLFAVPYRLDRKAAAYLARSLRRQREGWRSAASLVASVGLRDGGLTDWNRLGALPL